MIVQSKVSVFVLLAVLSLLLVACPNATPSSGNTVFSGKLLNRATGAGVSGLTVDFAGNTTTTGGDGGFRIDLGSGAAASGSVCVHGTGYGMVFADSVSLSAGQDSQVTTFVEPLSPSATHQVTIRILDATSTEIPDGTSVTRAVYNRAGGAECGTTWYPYAAGGLLVDTHAFGSDCLVTVWVNTATPFNLVLRQADLSASSTTVTLTQDSGASTITVNATGDAAVHTAGISLMSPYGAYWAGMGQLAGSPATAAIAVTNPYGYGGSWVQMQRITDYLSSGLVKFVCSVANTATIGADVSLPSLNPALGPNAIPDQDSIAYSGGTISMSSVSGANVYQFMLYDSPAGTFIGRLYSTSSSVTLPAWLQAQLSGHNVEVRVTPIGTNVAMDLSKLEALFAVWGFRIGYGWPPVVDGMQFGVLSGSDPAKTLTF